MAIDDKDALAQRAANRRRLAPSCARHPPHPVKSVPGANVLSVTWTPAPAATSLAVLRLLGEVLFGLSGAGAVPAAAPPSEPAVEKPRTASASGP